MLSFERVGRGDYRERGRDEVLEGRMSFFVGQDRGG
jgi:hypothetical protein